MGPLPPYSSYGIYFKSEIRHEWFLRDDYQYHQIYDDGKGGDDGDVDFVVVWLSCTTTNAHGRTREFCSGAYRSNISPTAMSVR